MSKRDSIARGLVVAGSVVLIANAALHIVAGFNVGFPALQASNLDPELKTGFRVAFLSLGWQWIVLAILALLAGRTNTRLRKAVVLICGFALLLEAVAGAVLMGLSIGNEMIGASGLLLVSGGLFFS